MNIPIAVRIFMIAITLQLSASARADQTIAVNVSMNMSPSVEQHKPAAPFNPIFGASTKVTVYWSGHYLKIVSPSSVSIIDFGSNTTTVLLPSTKSWYVMPFIPPTAMKQRLRDLQTNVTDMKKTQTLLGHKVRLFKVYEKSAATTSIGYVWVAQDIPSPPVAYDGNPGLAIAWNKLVGTMLKGHFDATGPGSRHRMSFAYEVTALSSAPIPASTFDIPSDYKKIEPPSVPKP